MTVTTSPGSLRNFFRPSNNFLTTFDSNARSPSEKKSGRGNAMTYGLGCISSIGEQKAQDKLDNLAAKPFLSQDYQLELALLSHPFRETLRNPRPISCRQYLHPGLFPGLHRSSSLAPPVSLCCFARSLARTLAHSAPQLVVWHPRGLE